jgi:pilus assembly protein CpaE
MRFWRSQYEFTIADLGHGLTPLTCDLLQVIDSLLLVTTDEMPALRQAKQIIRTLARRSFGPNRLRLVINRMPRRAAIQVPELERIMDHPIFAVIPNEYRTLMQAYEETRLVDPESSLGAPISGFVAKLAGLPAETARTKKLIFFARRG